MAKVIIFGGGDGGGIIIDENGVHPIPPWDPSLMLQVRALSALLQATTRVGQEAGRELIPIGRKLANVVMSQVEEEVGAIEGDSGFTYLDDDGGFVCGSTGKPPVPIPWPPLKSFSISEIVQRGGLDQGAVNFLRIAAEKDADLIALFRSPEAVAKNLGVELSKGSVAKLKALDLADPKKLEDPVDREIVSFFHKAVAAGGDLEQFATNPKETARRLDIKLSNEAISRIRAASAANIGLNPGVVMSPYAVAVVVVIVIVVWSRDRRIPVIDRSGVQKV